MKNVRSLILLFLSVSLIGCGYKPTSTYYKRSFKESVYVNVAIDLVDTQNSVLIDDAIKEAMVQRFSLRLEKPEDAFSQINFRIKSVEFKPLMYDMRGYISIYRAVVSLDVKYHDREDRKLHKTYRGRYDFSVESASIITDANRFDAIKNASIKAIDQFIAHISSLGKKYDD